MSSSATLVGVIARIAAIVAIPFVIYLRQPSGLWAAMAALAAMAAFAAVRLVRYDEDDTTVDRGMLTGLNLSVFLAFLANAWVAPTAFIVLYLSELIVPYLRVFARQSGNPLSPRWSEYLKLLIHTGAQIVLVTFAAMQDGALDDAAIFVLIELCVAASIVTVFDHGIATVRRIMPGSAR